MPALTSTGLPYPLPTDPVSAGAEDIRKLTAALDIRIQTGTTNVPFVTTGTPASVAVTFPTTFATAPVIMLTVRGAAAPQNFSVSTQNEAVGGFTCWATRIAGAAGSVGVAWMAIGKAPPVS
jgi:hypothetical protein